MVLPSLLLKNAQILTTILKYSIGWSPLFHHYGTPPVGLVTNSVIQR
jgi:hypothetical protein